MYSCKLCLSSYVPRVTTYCTELLYIYSADEIAEGILELITDTSKSGAVMTVTPSKGLSYPRLTPDPLTAKL